MSWYYNLRATQNLTGWYYILRATQNLTGWYYNLRATQNLTGWYYNLRATQNLTEDTGCTYHNSEVETPLTDPLTGSLGMRRPAGTGIWPLECQNPFSSPPKTGTPDWLGAVDHTTTNRYSLYNVLH